MDTHPLHRYVWPYTLSALLCFGALTTRSPHLTSPCTLHTIPSTVCKKKLASIHTRSAHVHATQTSKLQHLSCLCLPSVHTHRHAILAFCILQN
ncbi:MAG: hypothetical protein BYD32DRAFT_410891 [Podila humilis]|nr:MAG: hypothetical protein BYD32DRAFT_410891 [Podila humilis]